MDTDTMKLVERGVTALERLAEEPNFEIPTAPPLCPFCGSIDPPVAVESSGGTGKMSEFILECNCTLCNRKFFSVPQGWGVFESISDLEAQIKERAENGSSGVAENG